MSLKSKGKSVADTGAYEHLAALPNLSARRSPQTWPAGCEPRPHAGPGSSGRLLLVCLSIFQRTTNTPARWAPPDWTMTEAEARFKFCCRNDSSAKNKIFAPPFGRLRAGSSSRHGERQKITGLFRAAGSGKIHMQESCSFAFLKVQSAG